MTLSDWSDYEDKIAYIDIETFGFSPVLHPPWEVALIIDGVEHLWQIEWDGDTISVADPGSQAITHFAERYLPYQEVQGNFNFSIDLLSPVESVERFAELTAGRRLVGAVPHFDQTRMEHMHSNYAQGFNRAGWQFPWHYQPLDVEALALGYMACIGDAYPNLDEALKTEAISEYFGINPILPEERHQAMPDCRWARDLLEALFHDEK